MKKTILLLIILMVIAPTFAQNRSKSADKRFSGLDSELENIMNDWNAAGFAVAVVEKDKVIYSKGFGYSDYENKTAVTPNTLFAIGSSSKAFTSSLLGILQNEDRLKLDDSPRKYLPELNFFNDDMNNLITIRDMMSHRTGLPRHDFSWYFFPSESMTELLKRLEYQEPSAGIRERWQYNNFMFMAQGAIAERITGKTWEENIREYIFTPLGMSRSNFSIEELEKSGDAALGYMVKNERDIEKMDYYHIRAMGPAGSINSSVNEMSKWLITWIYDGKFNGKEIIPATYVSEAKSSQMVIAPGLPDKEFPDQHMANYGFGWILASYRGHYRVEHGGNIDGFSANACFFPSDSIGIVVLVNQNGSALPNIVRNTISDRMLGLSKQDWNAIAQKRTEEAKKATRDAEEKALSNRKMGTTLSHPVSDYLGKYSNKGYGEYEVIYRQDSLFASTSEMRLWLKHYHYDVFQPFDVKKGPADTTQSNAMRMNFKTNDAGEIESLFVVVEPTLKAIEFKRLPPEVELSEAELKIYEGEYTLAGMTANLYIKNGKLCLFVPGQPEYTLQANGNDKFTIESLDGFSVQFTDKNENVFASLLFIQPNGTFKATRKE